MQKGKKREKAPHQAPAEMRGLEASKPVWWLKKSDVPSRKEKWAIGLSNDASIIFFPTTV